MSPGGEVAEVDLAPDLLRGAAAVPVTLTDAGELDLDVDFVDERRVVCLESIVSGASCCSGSIGEFDSLRLFTRSDSRRRGPLSLRDTMAAVDFDVCCVR